MVRLPFWHFQIGVMPIYKNKGIGSTRTNGLMFLRIGIKQKDTFLLGKLVCEMVLIIFVLL